jgi:type II secretory pathway pseudopilin PulG
MTIDVRLRPDRPNVARGMTLLEVLVACGILVVGLASVAAILPAAASLLADAATVDRSAALAANAAADLVGRGVLKASSFPAGIKTIVIGDMFPATPFNASPYKRDSGLRGSIDEAAYGTIAYGATLAPSYLPPSGLQAGMPARLSIAVFRRNDAEFRNIKVEAVGNGPASGVFRISEVSAPPNPPETTPAALEMARRRFLRGCSWVLVDRNGVVTWLHIGSSWATFAPNTKAQQIAGSYVSFTDPQAATSVASGNTLQVVAFSGLVRLEERLVTLEP